jgi:hypothetical protein
MKVDFVDRFLKNAQIYKFFKICLVGADLFHAEGGTDRQADMTKLTVSFCHHSLFTIL